MAENKLIPCFKFDTQKQVSRNYQLDFLKLIFTLFVFLSHSAIFVNENTRIVFPPYLGTLSVHFFFVVSGMLMVNSILKDTANEENAGKAAMRFVLKKIKGILLQYWVAFAIFLTIYIYIYIYAKLVDFQRILIILSRIFPEMFFMTNSGATIEYNAPTWYLSAMFIVMLPLAYLLYKHRDFFLYVFAPIVAVLTLGYWYKSNDAVYADNRNVLIGVVIGGVIRALCGLCFGSVSWLLYNKIKNWVKKKSQIILLTVFEVLSWFVFFMSWFFLRDNNAIYSVLFILPVAVAISFSGRSYIGRIFKYNWMSIFSTLSLAIYLNHWIARMVVSQYFSGCSYKLGVLLMIGFTMMSCLLYFLIIRLCREIWYKKLKKVFSNEVKNDSEV